MPVYYSNPTYLSSKPAVLKAESTEHSVNFNAARSWTFEPMGRNENGSTDAHIVWFSFTPLITTDYTSNDDKVIVAPGRSYTIPAGNTYGRVYFKTTTGSPVMNVTPDKDTVRSI
jgi:hypothetical protein